MTFGQNSLFGVDVSEEWTKKDCNKKFKLDTIGRRKRGRPRMQHIGFGHLGIVEYAPLSSFFIGQVKVKTHVSLGS
jgi:hypothetical protein